LGRLEALFGGKAPRGYGTGEHPLLTIFFHSGYLQHERERPDMERKYMNSDKAQVTEPESIT